MTHCAERGGNEAAGVKARSAHGLKALSWAPRLHTKRNVMKERWRKSGKEGHKGQSGSDASFIE